MQGWVLKVLKGVGGCTIYMGWFSKGWDYWGVLRILKICFLPFFKVTYLFIIYFINERRTSTTVLNENKLTKTQTFSPSKFSAARPLSSV
jgi:hypothetical protein